MAVKRRTASKRSKPAERVGLGGGSVDRHLKNRKKRGSNVWYSIGDGNTAVVRAIDAKKYFKDGYVHEVEFERKDGSTYTMDIRCLDPEDEGNPCPGCRDDLPRRYKFWLLAIIRDCPVENASGKQVGEEDQVRILSGANRLVKALNAKHKRNSIDKRDLEISQSGTGFDTEYEVEWATDENEPLTDEDQELLDGDKAKEIIEAYSFHTTIRDEDEFYDAPSRNSSEDDDDEDIGERSKRRGSVFADRKKSSKTKIRKRVADDDDDEDEEEESSPPRRRRAKVSGSKKVTTTKRRRTR